jgi:hypothetical protein
MGLRAGEAAGLDPAPGLLGCPPLEYPNQEGRTGSGESSQGGGIRLRTGVEVAGA